MLDGLLNSFQEKSLEVARTAIAYSLAWFFAEISFWQLREKYKKLDLILETGLGIDSNELLKSS